MSLQIFKGFQPLYYCKPVSAHIQYLIFHSYPKKNRFTLLRHHQFYDNDSPNKTLTDPIFWQSLMKRIP